MKDSSPGEAPRVTLNREGLDDLRRANGIDSETDLARIIGVTRQTLWRVSMGEVLPSNAFIAGAMTAFPHTKFERLFSIEMPQAEAVAS